MKAAGKTYQEIGAELGVTRQRAQQLVALSPEERDEFMAANPACHFCATPKNGRDLDVAHLSYADGRVRMLALCIPCHKKLDAIIGIVVDTVVGTGNPARA